MVFEQSLVLQVVIALVSSQIYFPSDDDGTPYLPSKVQRNATQGKWENANLDSLVSGSLLKITLDVNRATQVTSSEPNFVFGPVTIMGVMALMLLASVGKTFDEIVNFMGVNSGFNIQHDILQVHRNLGALSKKVKRRAGLDEVVSYKTAVFVQEDYRIRYEYQQAAAYFYQSDVINLNFQNRPDAAQAYINKWVSDATNSKIVSLFDEVPPLNTKAIIVGVLYFKGAWEDPFIPELSKWTPFFTNGRNRPSDRKAMMMFNGGLFPYYRDKQMNLEILGLPYKGRGSTMYIILPNDSDTTKLRQLEYYLTPNDIQRLVNSTRLTEAVVGLPRMKITNTINLRSTLANLGVSTLFNSQRANLALLAASNSADLLHNAGPERIPYQTTYRQIERNLNEELIFARFGAQNCPYTPCRKRMAKRQTQDPFETLRAEHKKLTANPTGSNPGLYVDQFIHKVVIEINELGTEAAAASGAGISKSGRVTFKCDTPFLFFIYQEDTKMILFWGSIKSPTPSSIANGS